MRKRYMIKVLLIICCVIFAACGKEQVPVSIFNGKDLSGWVNVINSPDTWIVEEESITCSGIPTSFLRSEVQYENFILEFEQRSLNGSDAGKIIIHSDALPAPGQPLPRGILINGFRSSPKNAVASINGAKIDSPAILENENPVSFPNESGKEWVAYQIESLDGKVTLKINGKTVSEGLGASPRKGYLSLVSDDTEVQYRNIQIAVLPSSNPSPDEIANLDEDFISLYNGRDLSGWDLKPGHRNHWTAKDWTLDYDGKSEEKDKSLWTKREYGDFILIADLLFTREPKLEMMPVVLPNGDNALNPDGSEKMVEGIYAGDTGIYLRGNSKSQVNMGNRPVGSGEIYGYRADKSLPPNIRAGAVPKANADNPPGTWNRFIITMKGDTVSIILNGQLVIDQAKLPGIPEKGPIALQDDHATNNTFQFANLFIKELD